MIFDRHGTALDGARVQIPYPTRTTPDGGAEIESAALIQVIFDCIDSVVAHAGPHSGRIAAVVMDTLVTNVMGVSADGMPVTPLYTWADRRGSEFVRWFRSALDHAAYTERTGCRVHTSYLPVRLLWLAASRGTSQLRPTAYWLSIGEYLLFKLFGIRRVSPSVASWTGLLNRHTNDWDDETLQALPIWRQQLSEISEAPLQGLSAAYAERWPALRDALWFPAVADGVASNIGAGCTTPDRVALSVGTSGALRIVVPGRPPVPDGLFAYCIDESRSLVGGSLSNAGNLYAWLSRVLRVPSPLELMAAIDALPPDSHGLTVLPFLAGERAPGWNADAQAVFMGMTLDTSPEQLARAGLEAVAYRFHQIAKRLAPLLPSQPIFVASGAPVLNAPPWMQIIADVLNAPVYASAEAEATIRGAVYLALGQEPSVQLGRAYQPDPARHLKYSAAARRQESLYNRLLD